MTARLFRSEKLIISQPGATRDLEEFTGPRRQSSKDRSNTSVVEGDLAGTGETMMKRMSILVGVLSVVLTVSLVAQSARTQYVTAAETVRFAPLDPANPGGANVAVVSGDLKGPGPITLFLRLPKGPAPIHTHTNGYYGVLVRGQAKHWPASGQAAAQSLNPGSHWYQPGKAPHGDECLSDQCLLLIQMEGPYDFAVAP